MTKPRFKTVTRTQGNNAALKAGQIAPDGFVFDFEETDNIRHFILHYAIFKVHRKEVSRLDVVMSRLLRKVFGDVSRMLY